jgi:hypothetical protein
MARRPLNDGGPSAIKIQYQSACATTRCFSCTSCRVVRTYSLQAIPQNTPTHPQTQSRLGNGAMWHFNNPRLMSQAQTMSLTQHSARLLTSPMLSLCTWRMHTPNAQPRKRNSSASASKCVCKHPTPPPVPSHLAKQALTPQEACFETPHPAIRLSAGTHGAALTQAFPGCGMDVKCNHSYIHRDRTAPPLLLPACPCHHVPPSPTSQVTPNQI